MTNKSPYRPTQSWRSTSQVFITTPILGAQTASSSDPIAGCRRALRVSLSPRNGATSTPLPRTIARTTGSRDLWSHPHPDPFSRGPVGLACALEKSSPRSSSRGLCWGFLVAGGESLSWRRTASLSKRRGLEPRKSYVSLVLGSRCGCRIVKRLD